MLDEQSLEKSHVSKSKARRHRAATVRTQLWNSVQTGKSATSTGSCDDTMIATLHSRLAILEFLISDMHWMTIGQWRSCHGFASESTQTDSDDKIKESAAAVSAELNPTEEGGKAVTGEVSPCTSSCILQRSLDLVPRAGCTGPLGLISENLDPDYDDQVCWAQLPFLVTGIYPNVRAASKGLYELVEQLVSCEADAHTRQDVHDGTGDPCTVASDSCSATSDCDIENDDHVLAFTNGQMPQAIDMVVRNFANTLRLSIDTFAKLTCIMKSALPNSDDEEAFILPGQMRQRIQVISDSCAKYVSELSDEELRRGRSEFK